MANIFPMQREVTPEREWPASASVAIAIGDFLYLDTVTHTAKPFSSLADAGTLALNQAAAARLFLGVAKSARLASQTAAGVVRIQMDVEIQVTCASATFEHTDFIAPVEVSTNDALEPQTVVKTTDAAIAIGRVIERQASAVTKIWARLTSPYYEVASGSAADVDSLDVNNNAVIGGTLGVTGLATLTGGLALPSGADIAISGTTGTNEITLTDNLADALSIKILAGADLIVFTTTNAAEGVQILSAATQKLGFFGAAVVVQGTAYTQTFATANKTHENPTATATTNAFGTADGTFQDIGDTTMADQATVIKNNFQECKTSINALIVDLADVKELVNSVIDDLQAFGLVA